MKSVLNDGEHSPVGLLPHHPESSQGKSEDFIFNFFANPIHLEQIQRQISFRNDFVRSLTLLNIETF